MKVTYVGPHADGVELDMPTGTIIVVDSGATVEVPDEYGKGLLEQPSNWQQAKAAKKED